MPTLPRAPARTSYPADAPAETEVELIEEGPYAVVEEASVKEPVGRGPALGTTGIAVAALVLLLAAFAIMSRPGPEEQAARNEEAATQTTIPPTTAPTTSIPGADATTTSLLRAIPLYEEDLPEDLPGVISGFDDRGSLIVIDRTRSGPVEHRLGAIPAATSDETKTRMALPGARPLAFERDLTVLGSNLVVNDGASTLRPTFDLRTLVPDRSGGAMTIELDGRDQVVSYVSLDRLDDDPLRWTLSPAVEVLGVWNGALLVHRATGVWLVDLDADERFVASGEVLGFDGRYLSRLECTSSVECQVVVGTPDSPNDRLTALPPEVSQPVDQWASTVAVSPDGTMLALSVRDGGLSLPLVLDLGTGDVRQRGDGMNHRSPVAWSPDGSWLAYVFTNDVMLWDLEAGRSWRVHLNRDLQSLLWR